MYMAEEDIVREVRMALNKAEQVKILSHLNLCSRKEIFDILERHGVYVSRKVTAGRKPKLSYEKARKMSELMDKGVDKYYIAKFFGVSCATLSYAVKLYKEKASC